MNDQTDAQLLRAYAEHRAEPAFAELVRRHVDVVHSAAVRMVCDSHLAQDVTQGVFLALARSAAQLSDRPVLSGWLHRTAQNIAAQTVRTDVRRRVREQEAAAMNELLSAEPDVLWEHIAPHLDTALGELNEADRDALLLRYFERKSASEMATTLGISDEAAQKRVNRAVERLREFFAKRGLTVGASGLFAVVAANAVQAAPVGLAVIISTAAALAGTTTTATVATHATVNLINAKSITAIIVSAFVAGTATYLVQERETKHLRSDRQSMITQNEKLINERDSALAAASARSDELDQFRKDKNELLRLRGEVGVLRRQASDLEKQLDQNRQRGAQLTQPINPVQPGQEQSNQRTNLIIYIGGDVRFPGRQIWTNGISLKDVIESAGGLNDPAATSKAIHIKNEDGTSVTLNYLDAISLTSPELRIRPNDTIFIPRLEPSPIPSLVPEGSAPPKEP